MTFLLPNDNILLLLFVLISMQTLLWLQCTTSETISWSTRQRSARVLKNSRSWQVLLSVGKSWSCKIHDCILGKFSVSSHLKFCSLEKSRSWRNKNFESQISLSLNNFHWIVSEFAKFRKINSDIVILILILLTIVTHESWNSS